MNRFIRPIGVTIVTALLLLSGALGLVTGITSIVVVMGSPIVQSAEPVLIVPFASVLIIASLVNLILASGINRGNRLARMIITAVQAVMIINSVGEIASASLNGSPWNQLYNIIVPAAIILLLWGGEKTKVYFGG